MKRSATLAGVLALIALGSVSWASTNLNSLKSNIYRLAFENKVVSSTQPTAAQAEDEKIGEGGKMAAQTIKICKQTIPPGGTGFPFAWANGFGALPPFSLNHNQCNTKNVTNQDHFNKFTENVPSGWMLTNISCTYTTSVVNIIGANPNPAFQPGDNTVTIDLNEANVTCTFVNRQAPACCAYNLDLTTGQGSPIDPLWKVNGTSAYTTPPVVGWLTVPFAPARWIQPVPSPTPAPNVPAPLPIYKYTIQFNVPPCPVGHAQLNGTFAADNSAKVFLQPGNHPITITACLHNCFKAPQAPVALSVPSALLTPGPHTLEIDVTNDGGYSGLIVKAQVMRICP